MPEPSDMIEDPVSRYRVRLSSEGGDVLTGEFWVEPGSGGKAEHYHPTVEERFRVLEGQITYRKDGRKHTADAGTEFTIPAGARHSFVNTGDGTAHFSSRWSRRSRWNSSSATLPRWDRRASGS